MGHVAPVDITWTNKPVPTHLFKSVQLTGISGTYIKISYTSTLTFELVAMTWQLWEGTRKTDATMAARRHSIFLSQPLHQFKDPGILVPYQGKSSWLRFNGKLKQDTRKLSQLSRPCCFTLNMMTSSNGNIFRVTGHLWWEFTGHRWIPLTKASDAELWRFLWSASE